MFISGESPPDWLHDIDPSASMYQYMPLAKLVSLLHFSALTLVNAQCFEDPYEGYVTPKSTEDPNKISAVQSTAAAYDKTFISCWHVADRESDAMWKLYAGKGEGVAISTNAHRLLNALSATALHFRVDRVKYVDYAEHEEALLHQTDPYFFKRREFEHERELRIAFWTMAFMNQRMKNIQWCPVPDQPEATSAQTDPRAVRVSLNLSQLVGEVIVAPKSAEWYLELVAALCSKHTIPVRASTLLSAPRGKAA
jgi:hypothetical protein